MSKVTLPRSDIPISDARMLPSIDWYRWARDITSRVGGVTGPSTSDLSLSQFEDAGIEEAKAALYTLANEMGQFPTAPSAVAAEDPGEDIASLREAIMALTARVAALEQGTIA